MSSIIFPMEIWRVPRDSCAGRMYAKRVKLNMLVTANSTSAISWGSSWCQSSRTARWFHTTNNYLVLFLGLSKPTIFIHLISLAHLFEWSRYTLLCHLGHCRGSILWAWSAHVMQRTPGTCSAPSRPNSSTSPGSNFEVLQSTLPYTRTRRILQEMVKCRPDWNYSEANDVDFLEKDGVNIPTTHTMWKELCRMFCCREANLSRYISIVIDSPSKVIRNHR